MRPLYIEEACEEDTFLLGTFLRQLLSYREFYAFHILIKFLKCNIYTNIPNFQLRI